jgi:hypothetical protein
LRWPRDTLYPQKLALTSPTSGGRSVGIVRLRTKGHEFFFIFSILLLLFSYYTPYFLCVFMSFNLSCLFM